MINQINGQTSKRNLKESSAPLPHFKKQRTSDLISQIQEAKPPTAAEHSSPRIDSIRAPANQTANFTLSGIQPTHQLTTRIEGSASEASLSDGPLMGIEWDAEPSEIKHQCERGNNVIWYTEDDHFEIQCEPDSVNKLRDTLKKLEQSDPGVHGNPHERGWGLHVHLDIDSSFAHNAVGVHQAKKFFVAMVNIIPTILAYTRATKKDCDPYDYCAPYNARQFEKLVLEIDDIQTISKTPEEFFTKIKSVVGDEKDMAINLQHVGNRYYGRCGTLEFRFFQSPNLPRNVSACLYFINNVLTQSKLANDEQLKPLAVSPKCLYSIINKYSSNDPILREEIYNLFRYQGPLSSSEKNFPRQNFVSPNPKSADNDLLWDIRLGEVETIKSVLASNQKNGAIFSSTIEGYHVLDYAYLLGDKDLFDTFYSFKELIEVGVKPYTSHFDSNNFQNSLQARAFGFTGSDAIKICAFDPDKREIAFSAKKIGFTNSAALMIARLEPDKRKIVFDAIAIGFTHSMALKITQLDPDKRKIVFDLKKMGFSSYQITRAAQLEPAKRKVVFDAIELGFTPSEALKIAELDEAKKNIAFDAKKSGCSGSDALCQT